MTLTGYNSLMTMNPRRQTDGPIPALTYWSILGVVAGSIAGVILQRQISGSILGGLLGLFFGAFEYSQSRRER